MDAEKQGAQWAQKRDPRVTSVGYWLRRLHLDEFPQLWNVLRGHMSLVGPRPERPVFVEQLAKQIPLYRRRLKVRPGITGWAQVKHKYDESIDDVKKKVQYDLFYIENMSLRMDFKIMLSTMYAVRSPDPGFSRPARGPRYFAAGVFSVRPIERRGRLDAFSLPRTVIGSPLIGRTCHAGEIPHGIRADLGARPDQDVVLLGPQRSFGALAADLVSDKEKHLFAVFDSVRRTWSWTFSRRWKSLSIAQGGRRT
ncbi:MAG: sugar transferase [Ignavibacteriae bacterium]|nr:sugar transferase [Ignavibacteriota bacterium]